MSPNIEKSKADLLFSDEKIDLPKWVIFAGFTSSLMSKPIALSAYLPIILHGIGLLTGSEYRAADALVAVFLSLSCLLFLSITAMRNMAEDDVLDLYLALIFEKNAFSKFLKSKFQNQRNPL
ncbi:hypothetical protein V4D09_02720 [Vibrio mimicus]|uniref:hypothetical protein n=1 Tax=Vibrio mimicus TaxID=674 RepID=UPI002F92249D